MSNPYRLTQRPFATKYTPHPPNHSKRNSTIHTKGLTTHELYGIFIIYIVRSCNIGEEKPQKKS